MVLPLPGTVDPAAPPLVDWVPLAPAELEAPPLVDGLVDPAAPPLVDGLLAPPLVDGLVVDPAAPPLMDGLLAPPLVDGLVVDPAAPPLAGGMPLPVDGLAPDVEPMVLPDVPGAAV